MQVIEREVQEGEPPSCRVWERSPGKETIPNRMLARRSLVWNGLVTAAEGLTVHLTPLDEWLQLYVVELNTVQLVVREAQGKSGAFDYLIHGVRKGYEQHEVIRTKR